jgi:putative FmdB family regulatory protein
MPTYDYRCHACDAELEIFQSMKDKPKKKCPECGKNALERLIGMGAGVIFKGGGFYETDYRSESYKKAAEADKPKSEKSSTKKDAGGACACGQKPATQCASSNGPASKPKKPATPAD